jgi:tRNA(Met) C34 N-acetyltransferase TmcA
MKLESRSRQTTRVGPLLPPPLPALTSPSPPPPSSQVHEERWRRAAEAVSALGSSRSLSTLTLDEPVAWNRHDPLERWALRTLGLSAETFR